MKLETKIKRFEKLREWVREEPRRYNQHFWALQGAKLAESPLANQNPSCGTVACLAGGIVLASGYKIKYSERAEMFMVVSPKSHKLTSIRNVAMRLLGLSDDEADDLFSWAAEGWHSGPRSDYLTYRATPGDEGIQGRANAAIAELDIRIAEMRRQLKRQAKVTK